MGPLKFGYILYIYTCVGSAAPETGVGATDDAELPGTSSDGSTPACPASRIARGSAIPIRSDASEKHENMYKQVLSGAVYRAFRTSESVGRCHPKSD